MKYIKIENIKEGMILSKDVFDKNERKLLSTNNSLTYTQIGYLKRNGFYGLYIDTELTKDIEIDQMISDQLRVDTINKIKQLNIYGVVDNVNLIVKNILNNKNRSLDFIDIREDENYLFNHQVSVTEIAIIMGIAEGMEENDLNALALGAIFHDI
ncbi:MAG: hypothetical protein ACK5HP_04710, partial [Bacilli bacterium]